MTLSLSARRADLAAADVPLLAVALAPNERVVGALEGLDRALGGTLGRVITEREFRGGKDETMHLTNASAGPRRVLLVGTGPVTERPTAIRRAASLAARQAHRAGVGRMAFYAPELDQRSAEAAAIGLALGAFEYTELRTPAPEEERRAPLGGAVVLADDAAAADRGVRSGEAIGAGYNLARRLGQMPGNVCTPDFLAQTAREIADRHTLKITVLGRAEMEREGMGALLCVAQGTPQDPKLIALEYRKGKKDAKPIVLVGKGLCFDTGGISIKPAQGMEWMKYDMSGAGAVLGAMDAIARLGLPINVVALVGTTTNMPSGTAVKPGDVVKSHLGKSIEVINTDAEGRLVLADVLSYARRYDPAAVIDAATLTGACVIALGHTATGVFGPDATLVDEVVAAGKRAAEPAWPLPVWDEYKELIKSDVADVKNSGGRPAGAITAALFLKEFAGAFPWVHLDIAGTAYQENDGATMPKGSTGVPVGTFVEFARGRAG